MKKHLLLFALVALVLDNGITDGGPMDTRELKSKLTPLQYSVTQECGTEPPFRNEFWDNKRAGIYVDVVSGEPLFSSKEKFESGSGWPSFTAPLKPENIVSKTDKTLGMIRTEVRSKNGNSHLGHVFDDGPIPTGLRYCINSASLRFIPAEDLEKEGYGVYRSLFTGSIAKGIPETRNVDTAVFAAGCFWGVEFGFKRIKGVLSTSVGYTGGSVVNPTYEKVCGGKTGHAEAVEVVFDPVVVTYEQLLSFFWRMHDPTTLNRQGVDVGSQYRSAIFYRNNAQRDAALRLKEKEEKAGKHRGKIVTEIAPAAVFYPAEEYHQDYFTKNPGRAACHIFPEVPAAD